MATGKVRIFELAKELGLTSKELVALFNERLNGIFEAKNQLSVVPEQIADLVRSVLLKPSASAAGKPGVQAAEKSGADAAGKSVEPKPAALAAPRAKAAPAAPSPAPAKAAPVVEPISRLKPVTGSATGKPTTKRAAKKVADAEARRCRKLSPKLS